MQIGFVMQTSLVTARPDETVADAIRRMVDAGVGSVAVVEDASLVGIFTERDVLKLAAAASDFERVPLASAMTRNPITIGADDGILEAAALMGQRKLRHLPVVQDGNLVGMVSIRDVLGFLAERLFSEKDERAAETARALLGRSAN
ncbi:MAG: CBS domain-containing protein [Actinobacteria bacterium]|nr:CBS domain-containing protein [Actinomycetota bacterium]